jgi:hypothetical protein
LDGGIPALRRNNGLKSVYFIAIKPEKIIQGKAETYLKIIFGSDVAVGEPTPSGCQIQVNKRSGKFGILSDNRE